jgi:hypothetical protein
MNLKMMSEKMLKHQLFIGIEKKNQLIDNGTENFPGFSITIEFKEFL